MTQPLRIDLERTSPVPLYHQVAEAIQAAIDDGRLARGELLENEVAMAARLGISRPTTRQALRVLVDKGHLVRRRGAGTRVAPARIRRPVDLTSLYDDLNQSGQTPSTVVLELEQVSARADVSAALEVPLGAKVVRLRRLRMADGEPLAVMTNYLPPDIAPSREELEESGLYDCLRSRGVQPCVARQRIGARLATAAESRMLEESPRTALLTMERTSYDDAGRPIEFGQHVYRASRYVFDTTLFAS